MIAYVRGRVAAVSLSSAVLDVGGVGLELLCTPATLASLRTGTEATLASTLVVREDSLTLFGFGDEDERAMFELVQTASGIGPKVAQSMLAVLSPDDIRVAVAGEDEKVLTRVPGVGPKGARRIILELKDKVGPVTGAATTPAASADAAWKSQVQQGLVGLGWSAREADKAVEAVAEDVDPDARPDVAGLLRSALRTLSRT